MIPSHKEPQWLFWMSDDFKISNCFYPPVANIWDILMFNLFVCCSTFNTQSTWKSFSNNRDMPIIDNSRLCVNTTSRQGIKQLGNSFWLCFFFHFPMKVGRGHIHSSQGKSLAPNCSWQPWTPQNYTYCRLEIACDEFCSRTTSL